MLSLLGALAVGYGLVCGLVAWQQTRLILFPLPRLEGNPKDLGLSYSDLEIASGEGRLHGWSIPPASGDHWVLFCHGNGGNISHRLEVARLLHELDLGVVLFDYRGFGQSRGEITSEADLLQDGEAAYHWLASRTKSILIYGESLGGGVASHLAHSKPCQGLVLQSTFTRLTDQAQELYPWLPVRWLSRFRLATVDRLPSLRCPVLVMHSRQDDLIAFHHGQALYAAAAEPKHWCELRGGHNSTDFTRMGPALQKWLDELVRPRRGRSAPDGSAR